MTNIIGLDLGAKFGYAVLDSDGGRVISGSWKLKIVGTRLGTPLGNRMAHLDHLLRELLHDHPPRVVAYEKVRRHLGPDAAHAYGAYEGLVHWHCLSMEMPPTQVEVAHAKQAATGKGRAKKHEMVEAARIRWGVAATEDEADALWIAETARLRII